MRRRVFGAQKATGRTALHESVEHGFDEITRLLIYEFGADCNIQDNQGKTPKELAGTSRLRDVMDQYEASVARAAGQRPVGARRAPQTPPPYSAVQP